MQVISYEFPFPFSLNTFPLMYYFHASFASSQTCLITQNKGTHRISALAHIFIFQHFPSCVVLQYVLVL